MKSAGRHGSGAVIGLRSQQLRGAEVGGAAIENGWIEKSCKKKKNTVEFVLKTPTG